MDGHSDGGGGCYRGDGLVQVMRAVPGEVFSVGPALIFKSVHARLGWGRSLPVGVALRVPAVPVSLRGPRVRGP